MTNLSNVWLQESPGRVCSSSESHIAVQSSEVQSYPRTQHPRSRECSREPSPQVSKGVCMKTLIAAWLMVAVRSWKPFCVQHHEMHLFSVEYYAAIRMNRQTYAKPHGKIKNSKKENQICNTTCCWLVAQACPTLRPHGLQPTGLLCPWGVSRQEYWSGSPCPPPGDILNPGI